MTISILLRPEEELELHERARQSGKEVEEYVQELIRQDLTGAVARETPRNSSPTFDEVFAPIREGFAQSGMSEKEIMTLFEEARQEVRQERRARRGAS
jgi:hypothetical protein